MTDKIQCQIHKKLALASSQLNKTMTNTLLTVNGNIKTINVKLKHYSHCTTTQQPPFYAHYTGQPSLASTSSYELKDTLVQTTLITIHLLFINVFCTRAFQFRQKSFQSIRFSLPNRFFRFDSPI